MTDKDAIEQLNKIDCENVTNVSCEYNVTGCSECNFMIARSKAINALEEMEKRRWIPVSERLPDEEKEYWCAMKKGYESVLEFSNDLYKVDKFAFIQFKGKKQKGFYDYDSEWGYRYCDDVIAWQPLPDKFKGGES